MMLPKEIQKRIANATVTITKQGGRGVLVPSNLILTAAHCVEFTITGEMALGEYFIEDIQTVRGPLKVQPLAVEPVADIAVLGALDNQEFYDEANAFEEFCDNTRPLSLCTLDFALFDPFPVWIYTHKNTWIEASAQQCAQNAPTLPIEASTNIEGGTSGSPVVNERGQIVGIASSAGGTDGASTHVVVSRSHLTLPVWVMQQIQKSESSNTKKNLEAQKLNLRNSWSKK